MYAYTNQGNTQMTGGGQGYVYNPAIGNGPLPPGFQGTVNKAYTRTPQQNALVQHQITGLLNANNPYIRNARQRGREEAAGRGLLNSSMAAGSAERAGIESALPIASQDAQTFAQAEAQNLDALNQMSQLQNQLDANLQGARIGARASTASARIGQEGALRRQREQLAYSGEQAGLDRAHQLGMQQFGLGSDLTRMGYGAQWDNWLQDQGTTRQMERDLYNTQLGLVSGYGNYLNNAMLGALQYGMFNPEYMANPQQMSNLIGGIGQMSMPLFNNFFNNIFGGVGGP